MNDSLAVIACKDKIAHRANMAGFKFNQDDIVCTQELDGSQVVFLHRFFRSYEGDEEGNFILDENLERIPVFQPTAWLEYDKKYGKTTPSGMMLPRLAARYPWLFFIIRGGQIIDGAIAGLPRSSG